MDGTERIKEFFKKEAVFCCGSILALISSFFVKPDSEYLSYIDTDTIIILFSLMAAMAGLRQTGIFEFTAESLLRCVRSQRGIMMILVLLCFFSSMLITNDVALITFVPFALTVLSRAKSDRLIIPTVILQTVAANLGSMMTPIGNPQNLYLFSKSSMTTSGFVSLMMPYTVVSLILLIIFVYARPSTTADVRLGKPTKVKTDFRIVMYPLLFAVCLISVGRIIPRVWAFVIVTAAVLLFDRRIFARVDYGLLATFCVFFIFIGNIGRIESFRGLLTSMINGHECAVAVAASQVVSNVPAALLLSGFTDNWSALIVGTNLGGLGTLIASMASLISFKYVAAANGANTARYLLDFTIVNIIFLAVLCALAAII